jgi:hypothetical protein
MPLYDLIDSETNEIQEVFMTYSKLQEYLEENPTLSQMPAAPALVSGVRGITHKNDSGFNDMLSRIADANPTSPLAETRGSKGIKESKTRDAVRKQRVRQASSRFMI